MNDSYTRHICGIDNSRTWKDYPLSEKLGTMLCWTVVAISGAVPIAAILVSLANFANLNPFN